MSKNINFNLVLKNNTITTVEELQKNFCIDEILWHYHNGLLKKWLAVRGLNDYLNSVNEIDSYNNKDITFNLIKIFNIKMDENKINEELRIIDNTEKRILRLKEYEDINFKAKQIISDYHAGYYSLIDDIVKNNDNISKIKALVGMLEENYIECFKLNYRELYYKLINEAPIAIFTMLESSEIRKYFIADENSNADVNEINTNLMEIFMDKNLLNQKLGGEISEIENVIKNI